MWNGGCKPQECHFLVFAVVLFATAAAPWHPAQASALRETRPVRVAEFGVRRRCGACVAFTQALIEAVRSSQPGPQYTSAQDRARLVARNDHVEEVIDAAVARALRDFVWVEMDVVPDDAGAARAMQGTGQQKGKEKNEKRRRRSAFWPLQHLRSKNVLSPKTVAALEEQVAGGGDVAFSNFIRGDVLMQHEELIERLIATNALLVPAHEWRAREASRVRNSAAWQPTPLMLQTAEQLCGDTCGACGGVQPSLFPEWAYVEYPDVAPAQQDDGEDGEDGEDGDAAGRWKKIRDEL